MDDKLVEKGADDHELAKLGLKKPFVFVLVAGKKDEADLVFMGLDKSLVDQPVTEGTL